MLYVVGRLEEQWGTSGEGKGGVVVVGGKVQNDASSFATSPLENKTYAPNASTHLTEKTNLLASIVLMHDFLFELCLIQSKYSLELLAKLGTTPLNAHWSRPFLPVEGGKVEPSEW